MIEPGTELYHLLYEDENGQVVGLDEVQLLEPIPEFRIPRLREFLSSADVFEAYQAALVLASWVDPKGLDAIERFIDERVDQKVELSPHRIDDYENAYDEMAYAIHLASLSSESDALQQQCERINRKLLALYGPVQFESRLKHALLRSRFTSLEPDIQRAICRALDRGHDYLASQLLPVLAKWNPTAAWKLVPRFMPLRNAIPSPLYNVAQALGDIDTTDSRAILLNLATDRDIELAAEANRSLTRLKIRH